MSIVPGKVGVILFPFLQKGVPSLFCLLRSIGQAGGLSRKNLLSHQAVVDEIEAKFEHADGGGGLFVDCFTPF